MPFKRKEDYNRYKREYYRKKQYEIKHLKRKLDKIAELLKNFPALKEKKIGAPSVTPNEALGKMIQAYNKVLEWKEVLEEELTK